MTASASKKLVQKSLVTLQSLRFSRLAKPLTPAVSACELFASMLFGIIFIKRSFVITSDSFTQVDATHWVLDLTALVGQSFVDVRDVCIFVPDANLLPQDAGLSLHVRAGRSEWEYRGHVSNTTPSDVFPTAWPLADGELGAQPAVAQVGITVEPLAELQTREATAVASRAEFAKRVALDLFRYIEVRAVLCTQLSDRASDNALPSSCQVISHSAGLAHSTACAEQRA